MNMRRFFPSRSLTFAILIMTLCAPAQVAQSKPAKAPERISAKSVAAPEKAKPVEPSATEKAEPHAQVKAEGETAASSDAVEKKEAGKEEGGEEAQFKESATVKAIGSKLGLSPTQSYWLFVVINFAILAYLIWLGSKSSLPALFRDRSAAIKKGMDDARKASEEANARLSSIEARLSRLDADIRDMQSSAQAAAAAEEQRLKTATEEETRKILETAEQEIAAASTVARRDLKNLAAELAVNLAEKKISVDVATDRRLVGDFVAGLDTQKGGQA
jgi:F-type H+-transporting ATPase subunit b